MKQIDHKALMRRTKPPCRKLPGQFSQIAIWLHGQEYRIGERADGWVLSKYAPLGEEEMKRIAHCIGLTARDFEGTQAEVHATVADICEKFPMYK